MKLWIRALLVGSVLLIAPNALPQATEVETNHPCIFAQGLGAVSLPFMVSGALDALHVEGDVDFYSFRGTPNTGVQVDLEGQDAGAGTLANPFLGLFDSSCRLLTMNDNADSRDSRVFAVVPDDGVLIVAASGCCDHGFHGEIGVGGSYRVLIRPATLIRSIRGRMVDAVTGAPLDGSEFPFPRVELYRCVGSDCRDRVDGRSPASSGVFEFESNPFGEPLFAGSYQLLFSAQHYDDGESLPFVVAELEERDLGDFALAPLARIGSIRGRIVDSVFSAPLAGDDPPFVSVRLNRCDGSDCSFADQTRTDAQGRFLFGDELFRLLEPGIYQVEAEAEEYRPAIGASVSVEEGEDVEVSDLPLEPFPVGFTEIRPCGDLPRQGGFCKFSLRVVNRLKKRVEGGAWSLVESFSTGSLVDRTLFQAGAAKIVMLPPLGSRVAPFSFRIPETFDNGSSVCAEIYFGQTRTDFFFDTVARRDLFCITKGANGLLRLLDEKESRELIRERSALRSRGAAGPRRSPSLR